MAEARWSRGVRVLALVVVAALGLSACGRSSDDGRPVVLATFTVLADIAQNVAGDRLRVESLTKVGAEIHGYEPTPSDLRRAAEASLIVENGLNLEAWFDRFVADLDVPHVVASTGVTPIDIASDAYAGKPNPHAWMSPRNVEIYVDNLVNAFSERHRGDADYFRANGEAYKERLRAVQDDLSGRLDGLPDNQRALVTCEGAFSYLARDAGLTERYIWPVNADGQGTPQQVASLITFVRDNRVPAVFCESTVSPKAMDQVVEATGTRFGGVLYVDSLSGPDGPVPTYLDLITYDVGVIADGLTGGAS